MFGKERLTALQKTGLLDTPSEARFDRLTRLASNALDTEIALVSLLDDKRQWFKSKHGLDVSETPIEHAFCSHAIQSDEVMVVHDAGVDPRFANNPMVIGEPNIAFYAGAPLITKEGHALGTLCVIDSKPRANFGEEDRQILSDIAASVMTEIDSAPLSAIFKTTLAPFLTPQNRQRVRFHKDNDFDVSARGAFTLTLMLNELATNALKYGALSNLMP